jgi:8-oxo-dGTP pyrophosphatase MutT (NUDIX family)
MLSQNISILQAWREHSPRWTDIPTPQLDATYTAYIDALENPKPAEAHCTVSAMILDASGQSTLLLFHKKLDKWLQPGGHIEEGEDFWQSCLREAEEETELPNLTLHPLWTPLPASPAASLAAPAAPAIPLGLQIFTIPQSAKQAQHLHLDVCFVLQSQADLKTEPQAFQLSGTSLKWLPLLELVRPPYDPGLSLYCQWLIKALDTLTSSETALSSLTESEHAWQAGGKIG